MQKRRHMPPLFSIFPLPVLFSPLSLYFPIISPILIWQVFHAILQAAFLPHLRVLSLHPPFLSPHPPFLSPHPPFLSLFVYCRVETPITRYIPHRSVRAQFRHTALHDTYASDYPYRLT